MHYCPRCGTQQNAQSRFCAVCGCNLSEPQAPVYAPVPPSTPNPYGAPNPYGTPCAPSTGADLKSARTFALISLILCGAGFLTRALSLLVLNAIYSHHGVSVTLSIFDDIIAVILMAILPGLSMFFTHTARRNSAKGLQIGAICVLAIQALGILIRTMYMLSLMFDLSSLARLFSYMCNVFYFIGGTNLLASLLSLFSSGVYFFFHILYLLSAICYLGTTAASFLAARKLARS